jgi:hypothetical protein
MGRPKEYRAILGYKYQILCRSLGCRVWDYCSYAKDDEDLDYLSSRYAAFEDWEFLVITLPRKYWKV